jgi:phosphomannomutase
VLQNALNAGLAAAGAEVIDIGLCGTEEVYFATEHFGAGGGLMVTASHNPKGDNGIKMVGPGATPISRESGLAEIEALAAGGTLAARVGGTIRSEDPRPAYVERILSFVDPSALAPFNVVVNAGNGAAGPTFDAIATALGKAGAPLSFHRIHHDPDPDFPNGIPNPLLPENQPVTSEAVRRAGRGYRHRMGRRLRPLFPLRRDRRLRAGRIRGRPAGCRDARAGTRRADRA